MKKLLLTVLTVTAVIYSTFTFADSPVLSWAVIGNAKVYPIYHPNKSMFMIVALDDLSDKKGVWLKGCTEGVRVLTPDVDHDKAKCTVTPGHKVQIKNVNDRTPSAHSAGTYQILDK